MMRNDLLELLKETAPIKCAELEKWTGGAHSLEEGHTQEELEDFLQTIKWTTFNLVYSSVCIWLEDGSWITLEEYLSNWCWVHNTCPEIPNCLKK